MHETRGLPPVQGLVWHGRRDDDEPGQGGRASGSYQHCARGKEADHLTTAPKARCRSGPRLGGQMERKSRARPHARA